MPRLRSIMLFVILGLSALISVLHFIALEFHWYWRFLWFDIPMHFIGGFLVGLAAIWLVFFSGYIRRVSVFSKRGALVYALLAGIGIGIVWELFELGANVPTEQKYILDTTLDLIFDLVGAYGAYVFAVHLNDRFQSI